MKPRLVEWMRQVWPLSRQKQYAVLGDYKAIGAHALADIALRGFVFSPAQVPGDVHASMVNEGRRQLALEIIELSQADPNELFGLIDKKQQGERS